MTEHLWLRLSKAKQTLKPFQSKLRVIFEDPDNQDASACILVPDPNWMACALEGDILPPIEAYLLDKDKADGEQKLHPYVEPIGPMTEEQAIEYLIMKDVPRRVWRDYKGNRCILKIVPVEAIPVDREYRNAWQIKQ